MKPEECERVSRDCIGLARADIHSTLEPRYCEGATWDVAEMQSDLVLSRYNLVAKMTPVVQQALVNAREAAAERQAAVHAKEAKELWTRFEGFAGLRASRIPRASIRFSRSRYLSLSAPSGRLSQAGGATQAGRAVPVDERATREYVVGGAVV